MRRQTEVREEQICKKRYKKKRCRPPARLSRKNGVPVRGPLSRIIQRRLMPGSPGIAVTILQKLKYK